MLPIRRNCQKIIHQEIKKITLKTKFTQPSIGLLSTTYGGHLGQPASQGKKWVRKLIFKYIKYWGNLPKYEYIISSDTKKAHLEENSKVGFKNYTKF